MKVNYFFVLLAVGLVLLNAFFVAAEFGMVKLRATRVETIKNDYGLRGRLLFHIHKHLDAYLSACQLGITLASLGLGWIGEPAFAHLLLPVFQFFGVFSPKVTAAMAFFVAFSFISFLHIVVGELMPKSLAIRQPEKISLWTAVPLYGFYWLMYPAIWFLNNCSNWLLRAFGLTEVSLGESLYSSDEIKLLINASHLHGELTKYEVDIIEHTLDFADLKVTEVMRGREEMVMLDVAKPIELNMKTIIQHRYSRYPIYDSAKKEVIGIIHSKDILSMLYQNKEIKALTPLIRPVLKVSRHLPAIDLLRKLREGMPHFALIYSHETLLGFVTLDNLLQVLIGRIKDEFHRTKIDWVVNEDGSLTVKGDCSIYSLEQALNQDIDIDEEDIETIAGLIFHRTDCLPKEGDRISFAEFDAVIKKMEASRVLEVVVYPKTLGS